MGAGELFGEAIDVVEVAIRLVLVLLVEFGIVEALVIEFWGIFVVGGLGGGFAMLMIWDF